MWLWRRMRPMLLTSSAVDRLLAPRHGPGVCPRCLNLTREPSGLCRACQASDDHLAAVVPISYSVGGEWLHHLIASYKRDADPSVPDAVADARGDLRSRSSPRMSAASRMPRESTRFELVTTVPSGQSQARRPSPAASHRRRAGRARRVTATSACWYAASVPAVAAPFRCCSLSTPPAGSTARPCC